MQITIRDESSADIRTIADVTAKAFATLAISDHTEHYIIDALRKAGALVVSLVAEIEGKVVGHIAFSPVTMSDGTTGWYGLGPVSVLPGFQRQGIGKRLIDEGLARLKSRNANGCCLVGHPDYYRKFGFTNTTVLCLPGVPGEVFFVLSFTGQVPEGTVEFDPAFGVTGPT